jgi:ABC-2 type transport system ATP-binding protein
MSTLVANGIRKEFGTLVAVNDVDISIGNGQVLGLIGPNGAGKTTLLRMLATLLRPTGGSAKLLGYDLLDDYLEIRKRIGYLPDFFNLYNDLTLRECLYFFAKAYEVPADRIPGQVDMALDFVELAHKSDELIQHLSRGMVQRLGMAIVLVHDPEVFLLDEPASGLDPKSRMQLRDILRRLSANGKAIIISSHILSELSDFCTHVAIMDKGRMVVSGAVDEVQKRIVGARKVAVTVLDGGERAAELVGTFAGARVISVHENVIHAEVKDGLEQMAALNAFLVGKGISVASLAAEKSNLEDLFVRITTDGD